ncbi:MAG: FmdB family zinc ribbon protein [Candidatus Limnocylindrales bacterium]
MPTYEYGCTVCGRVFEVLHGVHATGPERCEVCGGALRKLISAPAIHFKGSGWAGKDARDSVRSRSSSSTSSAPKAEDEGKTEGKKAAGDDATPSSAKPETPKASTDKPAASASAAKPA